MISINTARRCAFAAAASATVLFTVPAFSQDISESHMKAARAAVNAVDASDPYDGILPNIGAALKETLIQKNPDLQVLIERVVDEQTLALAPRRVDLEKEAALAYAKVMSEDELNSIAAFYESEPGKKLLAEGPMVVRELGKAADIWQRGIARDLAQNVRKVLDAEAAKTAPAPAADGAQPAPAN